jgi:hypothetical protein
MSCSSRALLVHGEPRELLALPLEQRRARLELLAVAPPGARVRAESPGAGRQRPRGERADHDGRRASSTVGQHHRQRGDRHRGDREGRQRDPPLARGSRRPERDQHHEAARALAHRDDRHRRGERRAPHREGRDAAEGECRARGGRNGQRGRARRAVVD